MKKTTLLMVVSMILAIVLGVGGTMAYLQDTDEDVNVMTLGSVYIVQNEQERDSAGILQPFTQEKALYPAVYTGDSIPWADAAEWPVPNDEAWKTVEKNSNVVDKFVTVTNIGDSEAYVRTIIAYEANPISGDDIHIVQNAVTSSNADVAGEFASTEYYENIVIDGARYDVIVYTYKNPLAPGATTIPSLKQVYLDKTSGNEDVKAIDTNGNGTYDIYVLSQAVQTMGFADAESALAEAFPWGDDKAAAITKWLEETEAGSPGEKHENNNPPIGIYNWEQLKLAIQKSQAIKIMADFDIEGRIDIEDGIEIDMDMNGHTLTDPRSGTGMMMAYVKKGGKLTIRGDGTFYKKDHNSNMIYFDGELNIIDGTFKFDEYEFGGEECAANCTHARNNDGSWNWQKGGGIIVGSWYDNGVLNIYGGTFDCGILNDDNPNVMYHVLNAAASPLPKDEEEKYRAVYNVMGGTFVSVNPKDGDCNAPHTLYLVGQTQAGELPDGDTYTITEGALADGRKTYTVNYSAE